VIGMKNILALLKENFHIEVKKIEIKTIKQQQM
jgi:hypothetical protein